MGMLALASLLLAIPLAAHALVGWSSRYMADDYCTVGTLRRLGFWESQKFWYTTWSGRYSFTFLVNLAEAAGVVVTRCIPALAIVGWVLLLALLFRQLGRGAGSIGSVLAGIAVGAALVFVLLDGTPNPYQSLYWQTGMMTYVLPLILLTGLGAWLLRQAGREVKSVSPSACLAVGLYALIAGGFSETYAVLQIAVLAVGAVAAWVGLRGNRKRMLALLASALLGAGLALVLLYVAPGTEVRRSLVSGPVTIPQLGSRLVQDARIFLSRTVHKIPAGLALVVALPLSISLGLGSIPSPLSDGPRFAAKRFVPWLILLPPVVASLLIVTMAPYEFAVSDYPDARVLVTSLFVLVAGLGVWGFLLGSALAAWAGPLARPAALGLGLVSVCLVVISVLPGTQRVLIRLPEVQSFAVDWERRDQALREAEARGLDEIRAASLSHIGGLTEIGYDPAEWINVCVAQAYGLKRVIAK